MSNPHAVHHSSARDGTGRDDWTTPREMFDALDREFDFACDAAADDVNALLESHFTRDSFASTGGWKAMPHVPSVVPARDGALTPGMLWPSPAWCNPPYSRLREFLERAAHEASQGATVVMLIPSRTDTIAWHECVMRHASEVRLVRGRLKFGDGSDCAPFPSAVVIFEPGGGPPRFSSCDRSGRVLEPDDRQSSIFEMEVG